MRRAFIRWDSRRSLPPLRQAMLRVLRQTFLPQDGPARAVRRKTAADFARAAARRSLSRVMAGFAAAVRRTKGGSAPNAVSPSRSRAMAGRARAERSTKGSSAASAALPSRRAFRSTAAINADGSRNLAFSWRNSALSAAIRSTTGTSCASPLTILPAADLR